MIVPPNGCAERAGTISSFDLLSSSKVEVIAINIMHRKVAIRIVGFRLTRCKIRTNLTAVYRKRAEGCNAVKGRI